MHILIYLKPCFYLKKLLSALFIICLLNFAAYSIDLDTSHAFVETLKVDKKSETVILMPGQADPATWYYSTQSIYFTQQTIGNNTLPEMTLIRYQKPDPGKKNKYIEGAEIQLSIDIDPFDNNLKISLLEKAVNASEKWEKEYKNAFIKKLDTAKNQSGARKEELNNICKKLKNNTKIQNLKDLITKAHDKSLDSWIIEGLNEALRLLQMTKTKKDADALKAIPCVSAFLIIYDHSGHMHCSSGPIRGAAPEMSSDKISFSMQLDRNAVDISEALLKSRTGIFMVLRREYEVLSLPLKYKMIIDYKKISDLYRRSSGLLEKAVQFSEYQLPEYAENNKKELLNKLGTGGIIKVINKTGSELTLASLDIVTLQTVISRVNRALLDNKWMPEEVNLKKQLSSSDLHVTSVKKTGSSKNNVKHNFSTGVRNIDIDKTAFSGTEIIYEGIRYRGRHSVISQGFLRIPEKASIHNQLIIDERGPEWTNTYFLLPGIGTDPQLGIYEVNAGVSLVLNKKKLITKEALWKKTEGWTLDKGHKPGRWGLISFSLKGINGDKYDDMKYHVVQKVKCNLEGKNFEIDNEYTVKAFDGESFVASPLECIQPVIFDFNNFAWRIPEQTVYAAEIQITQKLRPAYDLKIYRSAAVGRELVYLPLRINSELENDIGVIKANIEFPARYIDEKNKKRKSGKFSWIHNKEDLAEIFPSLFISITEDDLKK